MPGNTAMKAVESQSLGEVVVERRDHAAMLAYLFALMQRPKKAPANAFDSPSFRQAPASNTDDPMAIVAHLCDTFGHVEFNDKIGVATKTKPQFLKVQLPSK